MRARAKAGDQSEMPDPSVDILCIIQGLWFTREVSMNGSEDQESSATCAGLDHSCRLSFSTHPAVLCASCTAAAKSAASGPPPADHSRLPASYPTFINCQSPVSPTYAPFQELLMEICCMWCKTHLAICASRCTSAPPGLWVLASTVLATT